MKKTRKIIAILLTVLTLMSVISAATPVLATEVTEFTESTDATSETDETVNEEQNSTETEEAEILYEDISRRDEFTKHFVMSNGLNKAVKYSQPVHYKENDEWVNIDNTLEYNQDIKKYENKANSFKVKFDEKFNSEELFSIENKGYTMSWRYSDNSMHFSNPSGKVEKHSDKNTGLEKHKPKANGKIKYDKFEPDINLEYIVTGTGVKENIILESYSDKNSFSFEVTATGLDFIKNEDKSISVVNQTGEEIFYIPAPFMFDADNNYCYDVDYSIENKKGKTVISVIADKDWLKDKERQYPVTIDPVIETDKTKVAIDTTFIASGNPGFNFDNMSDVYIGVESSNYEKCRTLVKFDLPELNSGDMVIGATLGMFLHSTSFYVETMPDKQINAHIVTTSWNADTVTWNTRPQIDENVIIDYNFIKKSDVEGFVYEKFFDITKAVKEWYEGTSNNYGIMIKADVEDGSDADVAARGIFWSDKYNDNEDRYPYIEIEYRNNKGLESYWSYSSFGVMSAGTAHINDYTGNLVYELPILSSSGEKFPVALTAYYNNYCANKALTAGKSNSSRTTIGKGFRLSIQQTVLPSTQYGLSSESAEKYPYVYTDADGTEHYFIEETKDGNTVYKDEDGMGLTLKTDCDISATYQITDKAHNNYYFNSEGNLKIVKDKNGNQLTISFVSPKDGDNFRAGTRISKITDGAGHTFTFAYYDTTTGNYVESITDMAGRKIDFGTSDGLLNEVRYPGDDFVAFDYQINSNDSSEGRINAVYSKDIYELDFDYTSVKTGRRVKTVKEYSKTGSKGQVITFDRSKYNTTIIRSCGIDGIHYIDDNTKGNDDIITTIQFDNMGRAFSQQMKFGSGTEISAGSCAYTTSDSDESTSGFKNKVSGGGATGKYIANLLSGGNAENNTYWSFGTGGSVNAAQDTSSDSKYIGQKSLKLIINEVGATDGRCYYMQEVNNIDTNATYTFSAYVKTGDLTAFSEAPLTGAFIQVKGFDSSGNEISEITTRSQILTQRTDLDVNNGWRRLRCQVETGTEVAYLRCYLLLRNTKGSACFDGIQLEKGDAVNDYNMVSNSHFSKVSGNEPLFWSESGDLEFSTGSTVEHGVVTVKGVDGNNTKVMKITGEPGALNAVSQTIPVEKNPDDTYILSGWAKANAVNTTFHTELSKGENTETTDDDEYTGTALFEIGVRVNYSVSDGTTDKQYKTSAKFNTTISDWQCASVPISLKYTGGESDKTYTPTSIRIILKYKNQENYVYFDKIMLVKDAASSYTYDNEGNILSASSNSQQESTMKYDDNNNLTSYKDTAGNETKLTYDGKHNLKTQKSAKGVKTEYTYNNSGLPRTTEVHDGYDLTDSDEVGAYVLPTMAIKTGQTYFDDNTSTAIDEGAFVNAIYDENKNATTYTYNYKTGNLLTVTDPKGVVTTNTYTGGYTRPATVTTKNTGVLYEYDDANRLYFITFGKYINGEFDDLFEYYRFEYDGFGNVKQTQVGSQELSTNTYMANNGPLEKTVYGNYDSRE